MSKKIWFSAKPESMNKLQKEPAKVTLYDSVYENKSSLKGKTMQQWPSEGDQKSKTVERNTYDHVGHESGGEREKEEERRESAVMRNQKTCVHSHTIRFREDERACLASVRD